MNQPLPPPDLLRSAARLIERALNELDASGGACRSCGHMHYDNPVEAFTVARLANFPKRLREAAERLLDTKQEAT